MKPVEQRARTILNRAKWGATVVEVGVLQGRMAEIALSLRDDLNWIMVDNWLPIDKQPQAYRDTGDDHALKAPGLTETHRRQAYTRAFDIRASVLFLPSKEAARLIAPESVDVVFIDADHSYEGVAADIDAWRDTVRPGGWIGGHDYRNPDPRFGGVDRAVDEAFADVEISANFTWWVQR